MILTVAAVLFIVAIGLFTFSLCVVAKRADENADLIMDRLTEHGEASFGRSVRLDETLDKRFRALRENVEQTGESWRSILADGLEHERDRLLDNIHAILNGKLVDAEAREHVAVAAARRVQDDVETERFQHVACLSIAEVAAGWDGVQWLRRRVENQRTSIKYYQAAVSDAEREVAELRREVDANAPVVEMNDRRRRLLQDVKALLLAPGWGPVTDASLASRIRGILCRIDETDPPFKAAGPGKLDASRTLGARAAALRDDWLEKRLDLVRKHLWESRGGTPADVSAVGTMPTRRASDLAIVARDLRKES